MLSDKFCVLVADDHALNREAISLLLGRALPRARVFELVPGQRALDLGRCDGSMVLFGIHPPYMKTLNALSGLRTRFPHSPILLLADGLDATLVKMARARGADGLCHTADSVDDLLTAIRDTLQGRSCFPPGAAGDARHADYRLTPRQTEVLDLLCRGKSNKEIGAALKLSDNTVRTHVAAIFNALGARNRTEAVVSARHLV